MRPTSNRLVLAVSAILAVLLASLPLAGAQTSAPKKAAAGARAASKPTPGPF